MISRIVLIVGAATILVMGVFPPWKYVFRAANGIYAERSAGYFFIAAPPSVEDGDSLGKLFGRGPLSSTFFSAEIDMNKLFIQIGISLLCFGIIGAVLRRPRVNQQHDGQS